MSEKKENVSEIVSRWAGAIAEAADAKKSKITSDTLEARVRKLGEHAPIKNGETRIEREQREAKQFTETIQANKNRISSVMEQWNEANKYKDLLPLDKAKVKLETSWKLSKNNPTWSGINNPSEILHSAAAAEYLSTVALLPTELAEDPDVFFRTTARFAASMSNEPEARAEELKILNKAILHQEELKTLRPDKGFSLKKDDVIYTLRGFVLYDKELDGDILDLTKPTGTDAGKFLEEIQGRIETKKSGGIFAQDEAMYLKRQGDAIAASDYYVIDNVHPSQKYQIKDKKILEPFERRINRRVAELNEIGKIQRQAEYDSRTFHQSFEGQSVDTGEQLNTLVEKDLMRYAGARKEAAKKFKTLSPEEQEKYKLGVVRAIRERMELLEQNPDPWRIGGIDPLPMELQQELLILQAIGDHELYEKTHLEAEARAWQHTIYETMKKGASPTDTKEFMHAQGEFDKMEMQVAITKIPGLKDAFNLLDANYEQIMACETDEPNKKKLLNKILTELRNSDVCKTKITGVTPESALELSTRHFYETGRDAAWYRFYIRKHNLIGHITDEHGVVRGYVDPKAPLLWNPYRLLYCPEAMWTFFNFGSNRAGEPGSFSIPNNKGGFNELQMTFGTGVGADVLKCLFDHGFDTKLQDFYSRRKDYFLDAWIKEKISEESIRKNINLPEQVRLTRDNVAWEGLTAEIIRKDPSLGRLRELQQEEIKLRYNIQFADEFGVSVWKVPSIKKEADFLNEISKLKSKASGRKDIVDTLTLLEQDYTQDAVTARTKDAAYKAQIGLNNKEYERIYGDFFPSLAKYDISKIPYMRVARLQENKRGNYRDHINGLTVLQKVGDFVRMPSVGNFLKIDPNDMIAYTKPIDAQKNLMLPAYAALTDVHRGRGPLGSEITGLVDIWKSKFARTFDTKSLTDLELYKIGSLLVTNGYLSRDALFKYRGKTIGFLRDKLLEYADPVSIVILLGAIVQEESKKLQKDLEKS